MEKIETNRSSSVVLIPYEDDNLHNFMHSILVFIAMYAYTSLNEFVNFPP